MFILKNIGYKTTLLIMLSGVLASSQNLPTATSNLFSGSGNCTMCHSAEGQVFVTSKGEDISPISTWRSTMMANASKDPLWQAKVSAEATANQHLQTVIEDKCTTCHAPLARTEAIFNGADYYSFAQAIVDLLGRDGVSCTLCHQIQNENMGTDESYSGHYTITDAHHIFGPYSNPTTLPMFNQTGYTPMLGEHIRTSEVCATCHTLFTPYLDNDGQVAGTFPEQTPYLEWKNSNFPADNVECQTCHMPAVDEAMKIAARPPWLSTERQPVWKHDFVGGNTFMVSMMKNNADDLGVTAYDVHFDSTIAKEEMLLQNNAIDFTFDGFFVQDSLVIKVLVKNLAGHKFPTGFPSRRAWLNVQIKNQNDDIVFESGSWESGGDIIGLDEPYEHHHDIITSEDQVQVYESIMQDINGDVTFTLLRGSNYIKDNRLPPAGFSRDFDDYADVAIKGNAVDDSDFSPDNSSDSGSDMVTYKIPAFDHDYTVRVTMYYQTITPRFVKDLLKYETVQVGAFEKYYQNSNNSPVLLKKLQKEFIQTSVGYEKNIVPDQFGLTNFPNPFNSSTIFEFALAQTSVISFSIYNTMGQLLVTLVDGVLDQGVYKIYWDGKTADAIPVSSGVYLGILDVDEKRSISRILVMR